MAPPLPTATASRGGRRIPRRAHGAPGVAFLGLLCAFTSYAAVEAAAVVASADLDRPHVLRFASGTGLALALTGLALAALWAWLMRRVRPERSLRITSALGIGITIGLTVVFMSANGAGPLLRAWPVGKNTGLAAALALGLGAALVRWVVFAARHTRAALALDPLLCSAALLGADLVLRRSDIRLTSGRGLAFFAVALLAAGIAGRLCRQLPLWTHDGAAAVTMVSVPLLGAAGLVAGFLQGERVFAATPASPADPRPDVLLVVLDTTRADHAPLPEGTPAATPTLTRLAGEGTWHTQAFSTSSWTLPAHGSLFTGRLPSEHGATWKRQRLDDRLPTLAERLRATGRRTAAFSANPWIAPAFGFDRGFDEFTTVDAAHRPRRPALAALLPALAARFDDFLPFEDKGGASLVSALLRDARWRSGPAFTFLNLMEPHLPYRPPGRFLKTARGDGWGRKALARLDQGHLRGLEPDSDLDAREIAGLRRLYAAEVAYADWLLGQLVRGLERAGRLDRTLIVVTSDHGENLGDHPPLDHQFGVWDTLLQVPLLVRWPGRVPAGTTRDDLISLADLPALVLELSAADRPAAADTLPAADAAVATTGPAAAGFDGAPPTIPQEPVSEHAFVSFEYDRPGPLLDSLRNRGAGDVSRFERDLSGVRTRALKWIESSDGRHEAYDLVADPGELRNLAAGGAVPPSFAPLAALVRARARGTGPAEIRGVAEPGGEVPALDEETERRLRSLGYIR